MADPLVSTQTPLVNTYKSEGKLYTVPLSDDAEFVSNVKDAQKVFQFESEGKKYDVPETDVSEFMTNVTDAKPLHNYDFDQPVQPVQPKPLTAEPETFKEGKPDHGYLMSNILQGITSTEKWIYDLPKLIYKTASLPLEGLANLTGIDAIRPPSVEQVNKGYEKIPGIGNISKTLGDYSDYLQKNIDADPDSKKDVIDTFTNGIKSGDIKEIGTGFKLLGGQLLQSLPSTILAGAAGMKTVDTGLKLAPYLKELAKSYAPLTAVFAEGKLDEIEKNAPNLPNAEKMTIAWTNGFFENLFERELGAGAVAKSLAGIIQSAGREEGTKIIKQGFKKTFAGLLTDKPWLAPFGEMFEEMGTQLSENSFDKYYGYRPEMSLMDGVATAGLAGFAMGGAFGGVISGTKYGAEKVNEAAYNKRKSDLINKLGEHIDGNVIPLIKHDTSDQIIEVNHQGKGWYVVSGDVNDPASMLVLANKDNPQERITPSRAEIDTKDILYIPTSEYRDSQLMDLKNQFAEVEAKKKQKTQVEDHAASFALNDPVTTPDGKTGKITRIEGRDQFFVQLDENEGKEVNPTLYKPSEITKVVPPAEISTIEPIKNEPVTNTNPTQDVPAEEQFVNIGTASEPQQTRLVTDPDGIKRVDAKFDTDTDANKAAKILLDKVDENGKKLSEIFDLTVDHVVIPSDNAFKDVYYTVTLRPKPVVSEFDKDIVEAQKRLGIEQAPPVNISDNTEVTLDKIDKGEPVTNELLKSASDELYSNYKMLEAMKKSDQRTYTLEQIESMQQYLGEEITNLENHAKKQAEEGDFITKNEAGNTTKTGAAEDIGQPQSQNDPTEKQPTVIEGSVPVAETAGTKPTEVKQEQVPKTSTPVEPVKEANVPKNVNIPNKNNEKVPKSSDQVGVNQPNKKTESKESLQKVTTLKIKREKSVPKIQTEAYNTETNPRDVRAIVMKHFIGGGKINKSALQELFGKKNSTDRDASVESERKPRFTWVSDSEGSSIAQIAHSLWEEHGMDAEGNQIEGMSDQNFRNEIGSVIQEYSSPVQMAKDLISAHNPKEIEYTDAEMVEMAKYEAEKAELSKEDITFEETAPKDDAEFLQAINKEHELSDEQSTELNNLYHESINQRAEVRVDQKSEGTKSSPSDEGVVGQQESPVSGEITQAQDELKKAKSAYQKANNLYNKLKNSPEFGGKGQISQDGSIAGHDAIDFGNDAILNGVKKKVDQARLAVTEAEKKLAKLEDAQVEKVHNQQDLFKESTPLSDLIESAKKKEVVPPTGEQPVADTSPKGESVSPLEDLISKAKPKTLNASVFEPGTKVNTIVLGNPIRGTVVESARQLEDGKIKVKSSDGVVYTVKVSDTTVAEARYSMLDELISPFLDLVQGKQSQRAIRRAILSITKIKQKVLFLNRKDVVSDMLKNGVDPLDAHETETKNYYAVQLNGRIYIRPDITDTREIGRLIIHELIHGKIESNFTNRHDRKVFFEDVYMTLGKDEIESVVPQDYWPDPIRIQGEEYFTHKVEQIIERMMFSPNKSAEQILDEILATVPNNSIKNAILETVNQTIELNKLRDVVNTNITGHSASSPKRANTEGKTVSNRLSEPRHALDSRGEGSIRKGLRYSGERKANGITHAYDILNPKTNTNELASSSKRVRTGDSGQGGNNPNGSEGRSASQTELQNSSGRQSSSSMGQGQVLDRDRPGHISEMGVRERGGVLEDKRSKNRKPMAYDVINGQTEIPSKKQTSLPETIKVDGVDRPTTNSNGKPIHPTKEGIANFWKWFGDSKVVDTEGRPLVVYHGTDSDFATFITNTEGMIGKGSYFTSVFEEAADYAAEKKGVELSDENDFGGNWAGSFIKEVYLKISDSEKITHSKYGDGSIYVVSDPAQIKSATGNSGSFSEKTADIRYARPTHALDYLNGTVHYSRGEKPKTVEEKRAEQKKETTKRVWVTTAGERLRRGMQDAELSLKLEQEFIEKATGEKLPSHMDAYKSQNLESSKNAYAIKQVEETIVKPLVRAQTELENKYKVIADEIGDYVMATHAPERNSTERQKRVDADYAKIEAPLGMTQGVVDLMDGFKAKNWFKEQTTNMSADEFKVWYLEKEKARLEKKYADEDYAGLTEWMNEEIEAGTYTPTNRYESPDKRSVDDFARFKSKQFEDKITDKKDLKELWYQVKRLTKFSLDEDLKSGRIKQPQYDFMLSRWEHYVPLRGFENITAGDIFDYTGADTNGMIQPMKRIKGRKSKADDPFANMVSMAQSAIIQGNKNRTATNALYMVRAFPQFQAKNGNDGLFRLSKTVWIKQQQEVDGKIEDVWVEHNENDRVPTDEEFKSGMAKRTLNKSDFPLRRFAYQAKEEEVVAYENGESKVMRFSDPDVARSIKGINKESTEKVVKAYTAVIGKPTRIITRLWTTYSPKFILSNTPVDLMFAELNHAISSNGNFIGFNQALPGSAKVLSKYVWGGREALKPEFDANGVPKNLDAFMVEFLEQGAETGFSHQMTIAQHKIAIDKLQKEMAGGVIQTPINVLNVMVEQIQHTAELSEGLSRLATYIASRKAGKSAQQSAFDAHEITVNFTKSGKYTAIFSPLYGFFNVGFQSLKTGATLINQNKGKGYAALAALTALGYATAAVLSATSPEDDKDKSLYYSLSDYDRFNKFIIRNGKGFIVITVPHFFRAFYALGVGMHDIASGHKDMMDGVMDVSGNMLSTLSPINMQGSGITKDGMSARFVIPTAIQPFTDLAANQDAFGSRIYKEPFLPAMKGVDPAYAMAMPYVNPTLKEASRRINNLWGGDDNRSAEITFNPKTQEWEHSYLKGAMGSWNPSKAEHVFEYMGGGAARSFNELAKTVDYLIEKGKGKDVQLEPRSTPVLSTFYREPKSVNDISKDYNLLKTGMQLQDFMTAKAKEEMITNKNASPFIKEMSNIYTRRRMAAFDIAEKQLDQLNKSFKFDPAMKNAEMMNKVNQIKKTAVDAVEKIDKNLEELYKTGSNDDTRAKSSADELLKYIHK